MRCGLWGAPGPRLDGYYCHSQRAYCGQCSERIWGLARHGYKCINCKLLVHKRCHVLVPLTCNRHMVSVGQWGGRLGTPGEVLTLILSLSLAGRGKGPCGLRVMAHALGLGQDPSSHP